ncbi:hypothetical protein NPIL_55331 [Nephila pilipes]|uniref:Uncharacterized protein n=1 Tax=Nephila pilipes TaxID=299642 RepID=A0A8X6UJ72_NEPPI|nr:hypothetical protein NPIL_55331 [Nephila pilipes]
MEMNNDQQNERDYNEDSRSTISSISAKSDDPNSPCKRKQNVELQIQNMADGERFRSRLAHNFSIYKDYERPEYKDALNIK